MHPRLYKLILVLILGICYGLTIAPDLTWAHSSADSGDLITAVAVGGVPHPTGYPLYLLLAKAFQLLPFGTLAFRTNIFSLVCTILASLVVFELIRDQVGGAAADNPTPKTIPATSSNRAHRDELSLLGALAYGLAPAVWEQALVTEVYALHGLLSALCLYVFLRPNFPEWSRGLVFGIAACNHITSVLLFPILLLYGNKKEIALRFAGIISGLLLYLILPIRALTNPPINWGGASTPGGFFWLVSGKYYQNHAFQLALSDIVERLGAAVGYAYDQFTLPGLLLAFYGLIILRPSRLMAATLWSAFIFQAFYLIYDTPDSQVNLLVPWLCFAIWLPAGASKLLEEIRARAFHASRLVSFGLIALLLLRVPFTLPQVDVSNDSQALEFVETALEIIPENAMVFVTGDGELFSLWYARFALHQRQDVVIIAEGLLQFKWYNSGLGSAFPSFNIPNKADLHLFDLVVANPDRKICYISPGAIKCAW